VVGIASVAAAESAPVPEAEAVELVPFRAWGPTPTPDDVVVKSQAVDVRNGVRDVLGR
jgi:hypothetical protein